MIERAPPAYLSSIRLPGGGKIIDDGIAPREGEVVDQKPGGPTNSWATILISD